MAKRKQTPNTPGEQIAQQILSHYDLKDAQDVQNVMKQIFGPIFESMLKGEMKNHLGYERNERAAGCDNARNGYSEKTLKTSLGEVPIRVLTGVSVPTLLAQLSNIFTNVLPAKIALLERPSIVSVAVICCPS